ncbi:MAG TPA: hypothetical protein VMV07_06210 [Streptosporangiaceae bacterium]|nr:hypothetical protein [Streptosporangiaceae bacterium]
MRFTLNGQRFELTADDVRRRLRDVSPEDARQYEMRIGSRLYPVKQVFETATGIPRSEFTTQAARRHLAALGFELAGSSSPPAARKRPRREPRGSEHPEPGPAAPLASSNGWPAEAHVQGMVVSHLVRDGWRIMPVTDTAKRERGIGIVADRAGETLAIEVKGFPGRNYAGPRRAGEQKRAQPGTLAAGWYGRAVLAAMLARSRMPHARPVIALPDLLPYRNLFQETSASLRLCRIELWWVSQDGNVAPAT